MRVNHYMKNTSYFRPFFKENSQELFFTNWFPRQKVLPNISFCHLPHPKRKKKNCLSSQPSLNLKRPPKLSFNPNSPNNVTFELAINSLLLSNFIKFSFSDRFNSEESTTLYFQSLAKKDWKTERLELVLILDNASSNLERWRINLSWRKYDMH